MAIRAERSVKGDGAEPMSEAVGRIARGDDHVDIVDGGKPVAVVVSVESYRRLKRQDDAVRQELHEAFTNISQAFADVPDDELERELAKAQAEVRAEMQAERDAAARR